MKSNTTLIFIFLLTTIFGCRQENNKFPTKKEFIEILSKSLIDKNFYERSDFHQSGKDIKNIYVISNYPIKQAIEIKGRNYFINYPVEESIKTYQKIKVEISNISAREIIILQKYPSNTNDYVKGEFIFRFEKNKWILSSKRVGNVN
jgi:hypothetical protein